MLEREPTLSGRYDWILFDQGGTLFEPLPGYISERNQRLAVVELGASQKAQSPEVKTCFERARRDADAYFLGQSTYTHEQLVTEHLLRGLAFLGLCDLEQLRSYQETRALRKPFNSVATRYFARQRDAVVTQLRLKLGCHSLLTTLACEARLAIVSNNAEEFLQPLIARYSLGRFMQATLSSDALGVCKPCLLYTSDAADE